LDGIDRAVAEALKGFCAPREEWGPRFFQAGSGDPSPILIEQTLEVSSLAYAPRLLPRLAAELAAAGRGGFSVFSGEDVPAGTLLLLEVPVASDLVYRFDVFQEVRGRLAVIVDDIGYSLAGRDLLLDLDLPLTLAVLPRLPYSARWDELAAANGYEVILHFPMEAANPDLEIGPGGIRIDTGEEEIGKVLGENLAALPHAVGCNNHMGSSFTVDEPAMKRLLENLRSRGLFFVDSLTISGTATVSAAEGTGVKLGRRDVFLDHVDTEEAIAERFQAAQDLALRRGTAVVIGHYRHLTLAFLHDRLKDVAERGIQVVPVSDLVE